MINMPLPLKYRLICEGPSEWSYVQRLKSFLVGKMPLMEDGFTPRLDFYPTVTNDKIGGGSFCLVKRTYRKICPQNRHLPLRIWVDCDIYIRNSNKNESACAAGYAKKGTIPDFNFMVMNFEDFLAMHFPDDLFASWMKTLDNAHHFNVPLHSKEYALKFAPLWKAYCDASGVNAIYTKGSLPEDFVTIESLHNMIRHCGNSRLSQLFSTHSPASAFPEFLSSVLKDAYPEVFG